MTQKEIENIFEKGRLPFNSDFWWDYFIGTVILTGFVWGVGMITLLKFGFSNDVMIPLLSFVIGLVSFKFYIDHKIQFIKTGLSKKENILLLANVFHELEWKYKKGANSINLEYDKYILKWTRIRLFSLDGGIGYSFQYHSTHAVRFPIFIGIRTYLRGKFERKLHETMLRKS